VPALKSACTPDEYLDSEFYEAYIRCPGTNVKVLTSMRYVPYGLFLEAARQRRNDDRSGNDMEQLEHDLGP
jgi:hypothetical protein